MKQKKALLFTILGLVFLLHSCCKDNITEKSINVIVSNASSYHIEYFVVDHKNGFEETSLEVNGTIINRDVIVSINEPEGRCFKEGPFTSDAEIIYENSNSGNYIQYTVEYEDVIDGDNYKYIILNSNNNLKVIPIE